MILNHTYLLEHLKRTFLNFLIKKTDHQPHGYYPVLISLQFSSVASRSSSKFGFS